MKYVCLVYHTEEEIMSLSPAEHEEIIAECISWIEELNAAGAHVFSSGLQSTRTAITLREVDGKMTVTDGPFAETKEFLGGFTILEARDLNEAIRLASRLAAVRIGKVEIRPAMEPGLDLTDPMDRKLSAALSNAMGVSK
jgi:hypothetical protein